MRIRQLSVLIKQDLIRTFTGSHGQLFFVFFAIFWFCLLWSLSDGRANSLAGNPNNPELAWIIKKVFSWFFDGDPHLLFSNRPPTLSLYYVLAITTMPAFVLIASSNQTAGDISSKYLRFLIPRCTRSEIFCSRFIGSGIIVFSSYVIITICAAGLALDVDQNASFSVIAPYTLNISISLFVYGLPFIAIMSLFSAWLGSAGLSALTGSSIYAVVVLIISILTIKWPELAPYITYLLPSASKAQHLSLDVFELLKAAIFSFVLIGVYGGSAWLVFKRRDI